MALLHVLIEVAWLNLWRIPVESESVNQSGAAFVAASAVIYRGLDIDQCYSPLRMYIKLYAN